MRLIIVAGLLVGASLAFQSAHNAHASGKVSRATSADRVPASLPWYIATKVGNSTASYAAPWIG
jgi:hypothetical protein